MREKTEENSGESGKLKKKNEMASREERERNKRRRKNVRKNWNRDGQDDTRGRQE